MVNSWGLLDSEINGTMDEDYPIMYGPDDEERYVKQKIKDKEKSTHYFDWDRNGLTKNPFEKSTMNDTITFGSNSAEASPDSINLGFSSVAAADTIAFAGSHVRGGMGDDHISFNVDLDYTGLGYTAYDDPKYYASAVDFAVDSMGSSTKPQPNLKYQQQKYGEDKGIKDLKDYISSTYSGHYTSEQNSTQTLDLIQSVGDAESFCRSNAIKYLARFDKKGQAKRDILKAMHYCLLLYYFSGQTNDEITTRGYETF